MPTATHSRNLSFQASHPSIGPASTPDVQTSSRAPLRSEDLSAALSAPNLRSRRPKPSQTRREDGGVEVEEVVDREMLLWGWGMLVGSTTCFVLGVWSIAVGPFVDTEGVWLLDTLAKDTHYKYLLVFLVPVTLYAVIINWWGLKIFRHA